jgi:hypothetical protein
MSEKPFVVGQPEDVAALLGAIDSLEGYPCEHTNTWAEPYPHPNGGLAAMVVDPLRHHEALEGWELLTVEEVESLGFIIRPQPASRPAGAPESEPEFEASS